MKNYLNFSKAAMFFYAAIMFIIFLTVLLISSRINSKRIASTQIEIVEHLKSIESEISATKVLILESEIERIKIDKDVTEDDAKFKKQLKQYQEKIKILKNKYNENETDFNSITIDN